MTQKLKAISFLGYNCKGYSETTYISPDGQQEYKTKLVQEALVEFYHPDSLYVLLTETVRTKIPQGETQSNWDNLQQGLQGKVDLQPVTNIPETQTPDDIWSLFKSITSCLETGDQVIFDITHAFRSIPVIALIAVSYLRVVRNISIKGLVYGAFDPSKPNPTPIYDLSPIVSLLEWTTASDQFIKTGNSQQLAQLLQQAIPDNQELKHNPDSRPIGGHLKKSAKAIEEISLALNLTRPIETMSLSNNLEATLRQAQSSFNQRALPFTLLSEEIIQAYGQFALANPTENSNLQTNLCLQLKMIDWYIQHYQIVQAVTLAREWIVSLLAWRFNQPMFDHSQGRKYIENALNNGTQKRKSQPGKINPGVCDSEFEALPQATQLTQIWDKMTQLRNDIAHVGMKTNPNQAANLYKKMIKLYPKLKEIGEELL